MERNVNRSFFHRDRWKKSCYFHFPLTISRTHASLPNESSHTMMNAMTGNERMNYDRQRKRIGDDEKGKRIHWVVLFVVIQWPPKVSYWSCYCFSPLLLSLTHVNCCLFFLCLRPSCVLSFLLFILCLVVIVIIFVVVIIIVIIVCLCQSYSVLRLN